MLCPAASAVAVVVAVAASVACGHSDQQNSGIWLAVYHDRYCDDR